MNTRMKMDIEALKKTYVKPDKVQAQKILRYVKDFENEKDRFAFIGMGGTISSGYNPNKESLFPFPCHVSRTLIEDLQGKFGINTDTFASAELSSKDSRDLENADLEALLDFVSSIENERILITCGTYLLTKIAEILIDTDVVQDKIVAVTGSMLPTGFTFSDSGMNIMSAITAVDLAKKHELKPSHNVFVVFHGQVYTTLEEIKALNLHNEATDKLVIEYPLTSVPYKRG
ncbi:MAG TPA: asparaginase domain-containing protein [Alphaproteobacteria bacterium]|nr:asparaginase [Alphaproteobacteria bacterium]USO04823.1 MAG: asparaginase [Rhodospirillales bacterium]HOO80888.1 asparaginase domain-containing protein [Alphaproteobacteria bacterium]